MFQRSDVTCSLALRSQNSHAQHARSSSQPIMHVHVIAHLNIAAKKARPAVASPGEMADPPLKSGDSSSGTSSSAISGAFSSSREREHDRGSASTTEGLLVFAGFLSAQIVSLGPSMKRKASWTVVTEKEIV